MSDLVEQAARLVWDIRMAQLRRSLPEVKTFSWDDETEGLREDVREEVRAVLELAGVNA